MIKIGRDKGWKGVVTNIRFDPSNNSNEDIVLKRLEIY